MKLNQLNEDTGISPHLDDEYFDDSPNMAKQMKYGKEGANKYGLLSAEAASDQLESDISNQGLHILQSDRRRVQQLLRTIRSDNRIWNYFLGWFWKTAQEYPVEIANEWVDLINSIHKYNEDQPPIADPKLDI